MAMTNRELAAKLEKAIEHLDDSGDHPCTCGTDPSGICPYCDDLIATRRLIIQVVKVLDPETEFT